MPTPELAPREALHNLYRDHHGWLLQLLRRKLGGNLDHAADIAHDTFERVMKTNLKPVMQEPRGYLTTVATNVVRNHIRRSMIEQAYLDALATQPETHAPSPETQALLIEALDMACQVLEGLPARTRRIFLMGQVEGLPYKQIAEELDVSLNVVQKAIVKGIQHCYAAVYG